MDTHAFIGWLEGNIRLSMRARIAIGEPPCEVLVSAATAWEIATKYRRGKLPSMRDAADDMLGTIRANPT